RKGGYAFDCWTPEEGLSRGYTYGRIDDARYARNIEIKSRNKVSSDQTIAVRSAFAAAPIWGQQRASHWWLTGRSEDGTCCAMSGTRGSRAQGSAFKCSAALK